MKITRAKIAYAAKLMLPPIAADALRALLDYVRPAAMEYLPSGWPEASRGWNVASIAKFHEQRWPDYLDSIKAISPLGIAPSVMRKSTRRVDVWDIINHNNLVSFAYVLALASRRHERLSMLDWGGGIGHYCALSRVLVPDLILDYHCQDLPVFCEIGRKNLPQATFFDVPDACFQREYDLVFAGSSLWYARDWKALLRKLATSSRGYLFVTRMLFINKNVSFAAIQRPGAHAYDTEYPMWILNRQEFLAEAEANGMRPMREFLIGHGPRIHNAPEQGAFRGFLFRKNN